MERAAGLPTGCSRVKAAWLLGLQTSQSTVSAGSSGADLTCGCLYPRGLALVPALLCSQEDGIFLSGFQASQDVGGSVSGQLHLHWLA